MSATLPRPVWPPRTVGELFPITNDGDRVWAESLGADFLRAWQTCSRSRSRSLVYVATLLTFHVDAHLAERARAQLHALRPSGPAGIAWFVPSVGVTVERVRSVVEGEALLRAAGLVR